MEKIESKDNEKIKKIRKLNSVKYRREYRQFIVENAVIIRDALLGGNNFSQLFVTEQFIARNEEIFNEISNVSKKEDIFIIDEKINKSFSNLTTPAGICAVYDLKKSKFELTDHIIYLNNISVPGNLGGIFRSALAFGFSNIVLDEKCVDIHNYKVIQSAKDSIFKLNLNIDNKLELFNKIKNKMEIFSTSLEGTDKIIDLKSKDKFCLVFGNESHGVDKEILELSDKLVKINISNEIESLNVASSAAIIFYELFKE